ncbi:acyltransferase family protein [Streptomyces sp. NBC_00038]|uniref:acyltransferase family protein n=1 Tax=Streptomyces sp. NBC_00038 TaxID=2903615 RepID=UPI002256C022|nr:acyltransferase family protein [Streptomyces sp. NBC_00038]MCX5559738.1 acyltransferase family protein [Streptomyces sp. NBC_00038]
MTEPGDVPGPQAEPGAVSGWRTEPEGVPGPRTEPGAASGRRTEPGDAPEPQAEPRAASGRRTELDAIRTLVVIGLVFFHSAMVFATDTDFYVKNRDTTDAILVIAGFGVVWAMPMLFFVAGLGSWHSLHRRGPGGFATERLLRLGVPLLFATAALLPLPQWLRERSADPGYDESYLRFLPRFFDVHLDLSAFPFVVQGEYFETGHLWFVVLLLTFSLFLVPLARWFPEARAQRLRDAIARACERRGVVLLPALPLAAMSALIGLEEDYGGWGRWAYLLFFLYGFALATDDRLRAAMRRDAPVAAVLGPLLFAACAPGFMTADDAFTDQTALAVVSRALFGAAGWCWIVGIVGLLDRRGRLPVPPPTADKRRRRLFGYLAIGALPLYVLHQPIVVAVAYGVVGMDAPIPLKYALIVAASLALTLASYELLVRRTRLTRFLFGMRPR